MNTRRRGLQGIGEELKERLVRQVMERRMRAAGALPVTDGAPPETGGRPRRPVPEEFWRLESHPLYRQIRVMREGAARLGLENPFFRMHDGIAGSTTRIDSREFVNFASYDYLGLCGDPRVNTAALRALEKFGTSVSASRLVSGERPVHRELERAIADVYGVADCLTFVSGHATNVTTIGCLFGAKDLILRDALIHNSVTQGIQISGAQHRAFPHNDWQALDELLTRERRMFERVLIVLEGTYSMDGDFPDLPKFVELKTRHHAFLMVDEAHSFGVMGRRGRGIREHFGLDGSAVDIWMGTLSKSLASCGGYIAGAQPLIDMLRFHAPGFVYSVGIAPPLAAAGLAALQCMIDEPERVARLQARGAEFLRLARAAGVNTGTSCGYAVVPAITQSSIRAVQLSQALYRRGINVPPIVYPAVPEKSARLRFFMSSEHSDAQIRDTVSAVIDELRDA